MFYLLSYTDMLTKTTDNIALFSSPEKAMDYVEKLTNNCNSVYLRSSWDTIGDVLFFCKIHFEPGYKSSEHIGTYTIKGFEVES